MPPWILKAALQGVMSRLPDSNRWNRIFQTRVTKTLALTEEFFRSKWNAADRHIANFEKQSGRSAAGIEAMELGTGWYPILPIALALHGASRVFTVDLQDLLDRDRVVTALEFTQRLLADGQVTARDPQAGERVRAALAAAEGRGAREILASLGVESIVGDARALSLGSASVDLFVSHNTLEHIPGDVIRDILREWHRLARPDALMSHRVDMGDHYAHFDSTITPYNYLKYSDAVWSLFNNSLQYQNRLRVPDFRDLHSDAGWDLIDEENDREPLEVLRSVKPAAKFRHYREDELQVYATWMTSRPGKNGDTHHTNA